MHRDEATMANHKELHITLPQARFHEYGVVVMHCRGDVLLAPEQAIVTPWAICLRNIVAI